MEKPEKLRVLVVDDSADIRGFMKLALERAGFEVEVAPDGRRALDAALLRPADVLITDIFMPELDGLELIEAVKLMFPQTRILAVSGGGHVAKGDYLAIGSEIGADAVLRKPFTAEALVSALRELAGGGGS